MRLALIYDNPPASASRRLGSHACFIIPGRVAAFAGDLNYPEIRKNIPIKHTYQTLRSELESAEMRSLSVVSGLSEGSQFMKQRDHNCT